MKKAKLILSITILFLLAVSSVTAQTSMMKGSVATGVEAQVLKMEQAWQEALLQSDVAALEKLYADTLIYTHSSGSVDDKPTYIGNIKSGATKYESMTRDEIKVSVYGNTALVTCHWQVYVTSRGNKITTNARYLHVYVKEKSGWRMVAHQATRIAP